MAIDFINDKEKLVMKLLEDGKNFQEIAKATHVSFSFISYVNKKRLGQDTSITKKLSIPTQALELFSQGKSLIEVTITLDRPSSETRKYQEDYLRLKNMDYLVSLVESHYDHLPAISKLIRYIIQNPLTKNDVVAALELVKDISRLRSIKKNLEEKIENMNKTRNHMLKELHDIENMNQY